MQLKKIMKKNESAYQLNFGKNIYTDNFNYKIIMKANNPKRKVGQIYTIPNRFRSLSKIQLSKQKVRASVGLIRGLTPKRSQSIGKIVSRPCTPKKLLSIQIQTNDIIPQMQTKAIQVEEFMGNKLQYYFDSTMKSSTVKEGILKIADFGVKINTQQNESFNLLNKRKIGIENESKYDKQNIKIETRIQRKIAQLQRQSKQNKINIKQYKTKQGSGKFFQSKLLSKQGRGQKISKLQEIYEKNLAKYECRKVVLGDLLKQNQPS